MKFKIATMFMAVFALAQFSHTDKAHATVPEYGTKTSEFETTIHGSGCGCANCGQESEIRPSDYPV